MPLLFTMGHSTLPIDEFLSRLAHWNVQQVLDVRTIPKSRHNPQYGREAFERALEKAGLSYRHLKDLGGLRKPKKDSPNAGWRNDSFRGYADYMQTEGFETALEKLIALAEEKTSVIVCAEAVPWRCHRSLIADALTARGYSVEHIFSATQAKPHVLNPMAKVGKDRGVVYPPSPPIKSVAR